MTNTYTIVYACDNNFVPRRAASIKSLEINSPGSIKVIYIIDDGITRVSKEKLLRSVTSDEIIINFIPAKAAIPKGARIPYFKNSALAITVYYRIFIESFLPPDTEKVIYLDSDLIVLTDIGLLWDIDLGECTIGAVQDINIQTFGCSWGGITNHEDLGYVSETPYFNAGMLLIDFQKWVNESVIVKTLDIALKYKKHVLYADQYCMNVLFANKWLKLDPLWNHLVDNVDFDPNYHPEPYILHFSGTKPIHSNYWYSKDYQERFFKYLSETEWKNMKLIGSVQRKIIRFKRVIKKFLAAS